jgi:basic amino acid/polyamine antiporter, APA family
MYGTLITGTVSGLIAMCLDLDTLTEMISIGTLLAFSVVCAGVVILRYNSPDRHPAKVPVMLLIFFGACIILTSLFSYGPWWSSFIGLALVLITFIPLAVLKQTNVPQTFKCPLVPFVPCLGILFNVSFIVTLPPDSIYRLLIWTAIGFAIYFLYGARYSTLGKIERMKKMRMN